MANSGAAWICTGGVVEFDTSGVRENDAESINRRRYLKVMDQEAYCPVQRPSEKTISGVVIGISRSSVGSTGDITLLREWSYDPPQEVQEPPDSDCRAEGAQPLNSTRVRVEHSIGRLKRYARLADPYDGTISI